jgi:hypothetical protein
MKVSKRKSNKKEADLSLFMKTKLRNIIEFHYHKFIKTKVMEKNQILENHQTQIFLKKTKNSSSLNKFKKIFFPKSMKIK